MGEPQRLRPMPADRRALDEPGGVGSGASDRGGPDRLPVRGDLEQPVRAEEGPSGIGGTGEPPPQGRPDPRELRRASRDRDDRHPELPVERVQVEDVEPPHDRPVEENGADAVEGPETSNERDDPARPVGAVDPDPTGTDRLHVLGKRHGHRRDRSIAVPALERAVVDPDHPRVRFPEGTPQG